MKAKQYRLQRSDHLGVVNRGFGYGRTASWSAWRTIGAYRTLGEAAAAYDLLAGRGLTRTRLLYGKEVLRKSL